MAQHFEAQLYGECLLHLSELRYLGVWFDADLSWSLQIKEAMSWARSCLWLLQRLGSR